VVGGERRRERGGREGRRRRDGGGMEGRRGREGGGREEGALLSVHVRSDVHN